MDTNVQKSKPRNWVAKHNRHRSQRMRVRTHYQRHAKHRAQETL